MAIDVEDWTRAVASPPKKLTSLVFPNGLNTLTTDAVPGGTHALILGVAPGSSLTGVLVKGHQSGLQYYPVNPSASVPNLTTSQVIVVPVDSAQDSSFDISATTAGGSTLRVSAVLDTEAVIVSNSPSTPVYIAVDTTAGQGPLPVTAGSGNVDAPARVTIWPTLSRAVGTYTVDTAGVLSCKGAMLMYTNSGGGTGTATYSIGFFDGMTNRGYVIASAAGASGVQNAVRAYPGLTTVANFADGSAGIKQPTFRLVIATAALTTSAGADYLF